MSYDRGAQVLDVRGTTFDGEVVDTGALRETPIVLNSCASWCTVCDRALPDVERVARRLFLLCVLRPTFQPGTAVEK